MLQIIEADSIEYQFNRFNALSRDVDIDILPILSNHMVLRVAGLVENAIQVIFSEYCRRHSNREISSFIKRTINRENSLNTEKIKNVIEKLDSKFHCSGLAPPSLRRERFSTAFDE